MTRQPSRRRFLKAAAATGAVLSLNATVLAQDQEDGQFENVILLGGEVPGWQGFRLPEAALAETPQETTPETTPQETTPAGGAAPVNPTLQLQSGTTYTLLWKNLDGQPHTFAIQDADGNNLSVLQPLTISSEQFEALNVTAAETTPEVETTPEEEEEEAETTPAETTTVQQVAVTQELAEEEAVQGVQFTASEEMAQYVCTVHPESMVGEIQVGAAETTPGETTTPGA